MKLFDTNHDSSGESYYNKKNRLRHDLYAELSKLAGVYIDLQAVACQPSDAQSALSLRASLEAQGVVPNGHPAEPQFKLYTLSTQFLDMYKTYLDLMTKVNDGETLTPTGAMELTRAMDYLIDIANVSMTPATFNTSLRELMLDIYDEHSYVWLCNKLTDMGNYDTLEWVENYTSKYCRKVFMLGKLLSTHQLDDVPRAMYDADIPITLSAVTIWLELTEFHNLFGYLPKTESQYHTVQRWAEYEGQAVSLSVIRAIARAYKQTTQAESSPSKQDVVENVINSYRIGNEVLCSMQQLMKEASGITGNDVSLSTVVVVMKRLGVTVATWDTVMELLRVATARINSALMAIASGTTTFDEITTILTKQEN